MTPANPKLPIGIYVRVSAQAAARTTGSTVRGSRPTGPPPSWWPRPDARARFEDINVSGATAPSRRPGMGALLRAVEAGELGAWRPTRWIASRVTCPRRHPGQARDQGGRGAAHARHSRRHRQPDGEFTFGMLLQVAKLTAPRRRHGSAPPRNGPSCRRPLGPVPFGYRKRRPDTRDRPGEGPRGARALRAPGTWRGLHAPPGHSGECGRRTYTREGIRALFKNRIYATGRLQFGDVVSEVECGAIVDEPLWHAAQLPVPRQPRTGSKAGWLLTGLLKCAACGHNMRPHLSGRTNKAGEPYRRYQCRNRHCTERAGVAATRSSGGSPSRACSWATRW